MPYGTVNLLRGVSPTETPVTCTAGVGTFILEFATLTRLTGDPVFENVARRALRALWKTRSDIGLVSNRSRPTAMSCSANRSATDLLVPGVMKTDGYGSDQHF